MTRTARRTDRKTRAGLALALLMLVLAAGLGWLALGGIARPDAAADRAADRQAAVAAAAIAPLDETREQATARPAGLALLPGDSLRYRFSSDRRIRVSGIELPVSEGPAEKLPDVETRIGLEATVTLRVLAMTADGWSVTLRADDVVVTADTPQGRTRCDDDRVGMAGEVLAHLTWAGRIVGVVLPVRMAPGGQASWKHVLTCWQMTLPGDDADAAWEARERDLTGTYLASYARTGTRDELPVVILRTKSAYETVNVLGDRPDRGEADVSGQTRFVLDPVLREVTGDETVRVRLESTDAEASIRFRCERIAHERTEVEAHELGRRDAALARGTATDLGVWDVPEREIEARQALARTEKLLAAFRSAIGRGPEADREQYAALLAIAELMDRSPVAVKHILTHLDTPACLDTEAAGLIAALGATGTPEAQTGLRGVLADGRRPGRQRHALHAMARLKAPATALAGDVERIREANPEFADTGLLVLASMARKSREQDPERHASLEKRLRANAATGDERTRVVALEALGNLGPRTIPAEATEALADERPGLRIAGAHALLRVPTAEAWDVLTRVALEDADAGVRSEAIRVLKRRVAEGHGDAGDLPMPLEQIEAAARVRS